MVQILSNRQKTKGQSKITRKQSEFFLKLGDNKTLSSPRVNSRALAFIIYINDLPQTINTLTEPIIFANDTNVIISNKNFDDFCTISNIVLSHISKWFTANRLALNLDKTNITFITNNSPQYALSIGYNGK
jgi:hypothetical protein